MILSKFLIPPTDNEYTLGRPNFRFKNIYSNTATIDNLVIKNLSVSSGTSTSTGSGLTGDLNGTAEYAKCLKPGAKINGILFDGSKDITTTNWGTARNFTLTDGNGHETSVLIDGSKNITLTLPKDLTITSGKATQDSKGNVIVDTYLKKTGVDTFIGPLVGDTTNNNVRGIISPILQSKVITNVSSKSVTTGNVISSFPGTDGNGAGTVVSSPGGALVLWAGEEYSNFISSSNYQASGLNGADEDIHIGADSKIYFHVNCQNGTSTSYRKTSYIGTDGIYHGNVIGNVSGNLTGNAATATVATKIGNQGDTSKPMTFNWVGKNESPAWIWGGSDGSSMYVYNPAYISVKNASSADTAVKLTTARKITLAGSVTGSVSFNGTADVTITTTTNHTHDDRYALKSATRKVTLGGSVTGTTTINGSEDITITTATNHTHDDRYYTKSELFTTDSKLKFPNGNMLWIGK